MAKTIYISWNSLCEWCEENETSKENPVAVCTEFTFKVTNHEDHFTLKTDTLTVELSGDKYYVAPNTLPFKWREHNWSSWKDFRNSARATVQNQVRRSSKNGSSFWVQGLFDKWNWQDVDPRFLSANQLREMNKDRSLIRDALRNQTEEALDTSPPPSARYSEATLVSIRATNILCAILSNPNLADADTELDVWIPRSIDLAKILSSEINNEIDNGIDDWPS